jgi:hypothetical protein
LIGRGAAVALAVVIAVLALSLDIDVPSGAGSTPAPRLAYVTGAQGTTPHVWLTNLRGGGRRRIGPGEDPALSPDGSTIAASSPARSGPALILYAAGGGVIRRLFDSARASAVAQAWSPDSRYLAVVLTSRDPVSAAASGLALIDVKTLTWSLVARGAIYGASFAPDGSDRIAYALASSPALRARVDIYASQGAGAAAPIRLTRDGRSLYPVWGSAGIAYDEERLRRNGAPAYQVWLMGPDGSARLTDTRVPPLFDGLVPIAFSGDNAWLLAQYEGLDTSEAWAIDLATRRGRRLEIAGASVTAGATSRSGADALLDRGGFLRAPSDGTVEELPLSGGRPVRLVAHGSEPSWNL